MGREQAKKSTGDAAQGEQRQAGEAPRGNGFHAARMERTRFRLDLRRSLRMHWGVALAIALFGMALAAAYLVRYWPVYSAETLVYIQPAPGVETSEGVAMHWPYNYDPATYDSYVQQQLLSMTRADVLKDAAGMLQNFQKSGESEDDAAARLSRAIEVARVDNSYEVAIRAQAGTPRLAADMANAVAASYIENTAHEQKAGDTERIGLLREQADRVKTQLDDDRAELGTQQAAMQTQSGDLAAEIARLQNRYDALDAQTQNLSIDVAASDSAHVAVKAVAPVRPVADGVVRNAAIAVAAFLMLAMLAAVLAHKLDPRVYVAADVEQLLGFAPIAELPDFNEVSQKVFEEQLLRLAAAVEFAFAQGDIRSCVFTGAASGTGVSTIAGQVRSLMEGMSRPAVLVYAAGKQPAVWPSTGEDFERELSEVQPLMLIRRATEESRMRDGSAILADSAPLAISAETEFLVRNADCVVVVVESGATSRADLRATAKALQRLDADAVGYVLNRVSLAHADAAFRDSLAAMEVHVRTQSRKAQEGPVMTGRVEAKAAPAEWQPVTEPMRNAETSASPGLERTMSAELSNSVSAAEPGAQSAAVKPMPEAVELEPTEKRETQQVPEPEPEPEPLVQPPSPARLRKDAPAQGLPWWLADPILHPEVRVQRVEASETERKLAEKAVPEKRGAIPERPVAVPERREAVPEGAEAVPEEQESRLSSLRKLFADRNLAFAGGTPESNPAEQRAPATDVQEPKTEHRKAGSVPERKRADTSVTESRKVPSAADRRPATGITALPEFLPPGAAGGEKRGEDAAKSDAASRRERRDTWDDVAVLPSWRGQYRRKE